MSEVWGAIVYHTTACRPPACAARAARPDTARPPGRRSSFLFACLVRFTLEGTHLCLSFSELHTIHARRAATAPETATPATRASHRHTECTRHTTHTPATHACARGIVHRSLSLRLSHSLTPHCHSLSLTPHATAVPRVSREPFSPHTLNTFRLCPSPCLSQTTSKRPHQHTQ